LQKKGAGSTSDKPLDAKVFIFKYKCSFLCLFFLFVMMMFYMLR